MKILKALLKTIGTFIFYLSIAIGMTWAASRRIRTNFTWKTLN